MQVTTHEVGNVRRENGRYDGNRRIRGNPHSHLTIPTPSAHTEEPQTNDNSFRYKRDDLLGSLVMGKYGGSSEHSFDQIHCSAKLFWGLLPVRSKITDMAHMEKKAKLMARRGRKNIEAVGMACEQYDGGADNDKFFKRGL